MRMFFGLQPDHQICSRIEQWRDRTLPPLERPVPPTNLHITLAFLGDVSPPQLDRLTSETSDIASGPLSLTLDELGFWPRPGILWLGARDTPAPVVQLAAQLRKLSRRMQLNRERKPFVAHMTIARRCKTPPPNSLEPPAFPIRFDRFTLFESTNGRNGVIYTPVEEWLL